MIEYLRAHPRLTALLMTLVPIAMGLLLGLPLRRRPYGAKVAFALAVAALAFAWWALPHVGGWSAQDVMAAALLFGACAVAVSKPWLASVPPFVRLTTLAMLLGGLGVLEVSYRIMPPPPMMIPSPDRQMLVIPMDQREFGGSAVFPDQSPPPWLPGVRGPGDIPRRGRGARVLHLGDSMVAAGDVRSGEGFVDRLSQASGDDHVNLGVSNSSTDLHLTVFRRWQPRLRADRVVLHTFAGNDLLEIDRPYAYCGGGPLLGPREQGMPLLCPTPRWTISRRGLLAQGPSPFPLRIFAWYSALGRQMTWFDEQWMRNARAGALTYETRSGDENLARLRDAMLTLRDECARAGVPLAIVILPHHNAILLPLPERRAPYEAHYSQLVGAARSVGVPAFDLLPDLAAAVRANPRARWFLPPSPHFDVDGHAWYARWLRERLPTGTPPSR